MPFDLDMWHAGSSCHRLYHGRGQGQGQSSRLHDENVAEVVSATSSEGVLVTTILSISV